MCNVIVMFYRAYHVSIVIMCCEWCTCATFVALPLPLGAPVTFLRLSRASLMSPLLALPPCMQSRLCGKWYHEICVPLSRSQLENPDKEWAGPCCWAGLRDPFQVRIRSSVISLGHKFVERTFIYLESFTGITHVEVVR